MVTIKQYFFHFLKQNNVYEQYMNNFNKREKHRNEICPKNQFLSKSEPVNFIDRAFTYSRTKEGHEFWFNLSVKWKRCYTHII